MVPQNKSLTSLSRNSLVDFPHYNFPPDIVHTLVHFPPATTKPEIQHDTDTCHHHLIRQFFLVEDTTTNEFNVM